MKPFKNLTECETEVVSLLPEGHTNKAIAEQRGIGSIWLKPS